MLPFLALQTCLSLIYFILIKQSLLDKQNNNCTHISFTLTNPFKTGTLVLFTLTNHCKTLTFIILFTFTNHCRASLCCIRDEISAGLVHLFCILEERVLFIYPHFSRATGHLKKTGRRFFTIPLNGQGVCVSNCACMSIIIAVIEPKRANHK